MGSVERPPLRVLIANENVARIDHLSEVVVRLGHEVIVCDAGTEAIVEATREERPDVALIGLGASPELALDLIEEIVNGATCPVIAMLAVAEPAYVHEAAGRGVFAYMVDGAADDLRGAIDITLQRFAEYHSLQGAFGRRAVIEQAKGILMCRHRIDADAAFKLLREHSQSRGRKVADVAGSVVDSHLLLIPRSMVD